MKRLNQGLDVGDVELHALADGYLEPGRHAAVIGHLAAHPEAADRLAGLLRHRAELAALSDQLEDSEQDPQIEALTQQLTARVFWHRRLRRTAGASALGLIAGVTFAGIVLIRAEDETVAQAQPVEVGQLATTAATLAAAGQSDGTTAIATPPGGCLIGHQPDLQALGLHPIGGDAAPDCSASAVRFAYQDQSGRPFSLVVSTAEAEATPMAAPVAHDGRVAVAWRNGALQFTLVAPGDSPELLRFRQIGPSAVEAVTAEPAPALDAVPQPAVVLPEGTVIEPKAGADETLPTPVAPAVLGTRAELPGERVTASSL